MRVYARRTLAPACPNVAGEAELLLEGAWEFPPRAGLQSLDLAVDARHAWVDQLAVELAERLRGSSLVAGTAAAGVAFINVLALRYYLVRLLRPIAFWQHVWRPNAGEPIRLWATLGADEDYAHVLTQLARQRGCDCRIEWSPLAAKRRRVGRPEIDAGWLRRAAAEFSDRLLTTGDSRVAFCGNPRLLEGVARQVIRRNGPVIWVHERLPLRLWARLRGQGVVHLVCDEHLQSAVLAEQPALPKVVVRGVDLTQPLQRWLARLAQKQGSRQSGWLVSLQRHFETVRPTVMVLDEDATPFKRAIIAVAKAHGVRSMVVQHGAPCVRFGFAPPAAEFICSWGKAASAQLRKWGVSPKQIVETGSPLFGRPALSRERGKQPPADRPSRSGSLHPFTASGGQPSSLARPSVAGRRFLLLATLPPRDARPDSLEFHLTTTSYREMFEMACRAVSDYSRARLDIKLHPRSTCRDSILKVTKAFPGLRVRFVGGKLSRLIHRYDCILSCCSTAGIESAWAGTPTIQLLPAGSGDVLPAEDWGLLGSAHDEFQLQKLLEQALANGKCRPPCAGIRAGGRRAAIRLARLAIRMGNIESPVAGRRRHGHQPGSHTTTVNAENFGDCGSHGQISTSCEHAEQLV